MTHQNFTHERAVVLDGDQPTAGAMPDELDVLAAEAVRLMEKCDLTRLQLLENDLGVHRAVADVAREEDKVQRIDSLLSQIGRFFRTR